MGLPIHQYPRTTLVLTNIVVLTLVVGAVELTLRWYASINIATIGHKFSENARIYGWGFSPGERIRIADPDTGEVYIGFANNHGWRDRDRRYENGNGAYRVLVLGDSVTFGAAVPEHGRYTRVLETKLREEGYNAEVISIGYGGWGTDQQLEALIREGERYRPNRIIVQFCTNDIADNAYVHMASTGKGPPTHAQPPWPENHLESKPFYYELDPSGRLHRRANPRFAGERSETVRERLKKPIYSSEILKRLYVLYLSYRYAYPTSRDGYTVTETRLRQLRTVISSVENSALDEYLRARIGKTLTRAEIAGAAERTGYHAQETVVLRLLEDRWFQKYWSPRQYSPAPVDPEAYEWRLYFALVDEIKRRALSIGAGVSIFPETEQGSYEWEISWYRVRNDPASQANYLDHIRAIKAAMRGAGVDVIENRRVYRRARNDHHANVEGNLAMAEDILDYLMRHRKHELDAYRRTTQAGGGRQDNSK